MLLAVIVTFLGTKCITYIGAIMGRKKNRFYVVIPNSLRGYLCVDIAGEAASYKAAHFISVLTYHILINYPDGRWFSKKPISSYFLKSLYTDRYSKQVIKPLRVDGVIEVNDSYSTELRFSKEFCLRRDIIDEVIQGDVCRVFISKNTLIKNINDWRRKTLSLQMEKYHFIEKEAEMLLHLNIDRAVLKQLFDSRVEAIQHTEYKNKQLSIINAVRGQEEIVALTEAKDLLDARVRYSSGRVYHPLVNCPKEFRKAIVDDDNQPYVEIDLRSSQAVFLCKVIAVALKYRLFILRMNKPALAVDNLIECIIPLLDEPVMVYEDDVFPGDFRAFVRAVFLDDIYEDASPENLGQTASKHLLEGVEHTGGYSRISGMKNLVGEERDRAKKKFFKEIFFNYFNKENASLNSDQVVSSAYLDSFYKSYPTVAEFCRICAAQSDEKKKKSRDLALLLQQTESKFFHELLPAVITELEPFNYFVVHDAVYVPQKHQEAVIDACNKLSAGFFGQKPNFR